MGLIGFRKGVADEILAKKEEERDLKRKADADGFMNGSRKRSRSTSSYSSNSVSTISTSFSRSSSPKLAGLRHTGQSQLFSNLEVDRKRRRSRSSSVSYDSDSSHSRRRANRSRVIDSGEYDGTGPSERDPRRSRGFENRRRDLTRSRSLSHEKIDGRRERSQHGETRHKRRRHSSKSPVDRGRDRDFNSNRGSRRTRSPSESRDRSEVLRNRKSMTPGLPAGRDSRQDDRFKRPEHHSNADRRQSYSDDNDRYGRSARDRNEDTRTRPPPKSHPQNRERSLSPFSKRLKLTQAMNMGR